MDNPIKFIWETNRILCENSFLLLEEAIKLEIEVTDSCFRLINNNIEIYASSFEDFKEKFYKHYNCFQ